MEIALLIEEFPVSINGYHRKARRFVGIEFGPQALFNVRRERNSVITLLEREGKE